MGPCDVTNGELREVTADLLSRARVGDQEAFRQLVEPYRRHLQLHCYRILGSVHDAEDALSSPELPEPTRLGGVLWLEPYPDLDLDQLMDTAPGPEARFEAREAVSLAFVTATRRPPSCARSGCWSSPWPATGSVR
jgi:hypothetical protein